jgi:hypothetical protein
MRDVARKPALVAQPQPRVAGLGDDPLDAQAAGARRELVVLLAQPLAGAEQRALDGGPAHPQALADVLVAQALELAHHEDLVVGVRQPAERAAEVVEVLFGVDRGVRTRSGGDQPPVVGRRQPVIGVERDLLRTPAAAVGVDARVLRDLVDPRLERDRPLGLPHAAQGGDEHLLRDVLGAAVVLDHAVDVAGYPPLVAGVERLERALVAVPDGAHELMVRRSGRPVGTLQNGRVRRAHSLHSH